jgi:hypothetical protein
MKALLITQCSDSLMWYRNLVGSTVPFLRQYDDCYMSREPAGYTNIIKLCDAKIVELEESSNVDLGKIL